MRFRTTIVGMFMAVAATIACGLAQAVSAFEASQTVAGTPLVLNGAGTRYRAVFKVYDMALYVKSKASNVNAIMDMPGPKRINFVALRDLPGTDLGTAFLRGIESNSPKSQTQKHVASTLRLIDIFSGKSRLMPGDAFAMEFIPGKGTTFFIDGKAQGAPVGDAEFFGMVLRIWLGESPVDWKLKDALLGLEGK